MPVLIGVFVFVAVVGTVTSIVGLVHRMSERSGLGGVGLPSEDVEPTDVLRGGVWLPGIHASWPQANLAIGSGRITLRGTGLAAFDPIVINRGEVDRVEVGRWMGGVRFRTASGRLDRVTFWPIGARRTIAALERFGWPVVRSRWWGKQSQ